MRSSIYKIIILILAVSIGFMAALQLKGNFTFQGIITPQKLLELRTEIDNYNIENDLIKKSNQVLVDTWGKYEKSKYDTEATINTMKAELAGLKLMADLSQVKGQGVRIYLRDSDSLAEPGVDQSLYIIHDIDILNLVNELKGAGAEAIAVNGERVTAATNIRCGGPTILIDGKRHTPPFVIEAIGEKKKLLASLNRPDNYVDLLRFAKIKVKIEENDEITIAAYKGPGKNKFIKKVGSEIK